jgi:hypothetical protein
VELIRREQRLDDYLATQTYDPDVIRPHR